MNLSAIRAVVVCAGVAALGACSPDPGGPQQNPHPAKLSFTVQPGTMQGGQVISVPTPVSTQLTFGAIDAGWMNTCALRAEGTVYCWGINTAGQMGDGATADYRRQPVPVAQ